MAFLAFWREKKRSSHAPRTKGAEDKEPQRTQRELKDNQNQIPKNHWQWVMGGEPYPLIHEFHNS